MLTCPDCGSDDVYSIEDAAAEHQDREDRYLVRCASCRQQFYVDSDGFIIEFTEERFR